MSSPTTAPGRTMPASQAPTSSTSATAPATRRPAGGSSIPRREEMDTLQATLARLGARPEIWLYRNNRGVARELVSGRPVEFGFPGQADLSGLLPGGIRLEVELKSSTGRPSDDQLHFAAMVRAFGGIYVLARSADEVEAAVDAALATIPPGIVDAAVAARRAEAARFAEVLRRKRERADARAARPAARLPLAPEVSR